MFQKVSHFSHSYSKGLKHKVQLMQEHIFILRDLSFSLLSQEAALPFSLPKIGFNLQ